MYQYLVRLFLRKEKKINCNVNFAGAMKCIDYGNRWTKNYIKKWFVAHITESILPKGEKSVSCSFCKKKKKKIRTSRLSKKSLCVWNVVVTRYNQKKAIKNAHIFKTNIFFVYKQKREMNKMVTLFNRRWFYIDKKVIFGCWKCIFIQLWIQIFNYKVFNQF